MVIFVKNDIVLKIIPGLFYGKMKDAIFQKGIIVALMYFGFSSFGQNADILYASENMKTGSVVSSQTQNIPHYKFETEQLKITVMNSKQAQFFSTEVGPLQLEDNGKTRYYVKNGMMRERPHNSGDNLWRTSIAFIAYKHPALKDGMLSCTRWITPKHVQYYRSVEQDDEDVSRDQVTMFLVAMALEGEDVKKYIKATKWKLSKRFSLTIDMWLWMKALGGSKLAQRMFFITQIPIAKIYQLWNKSGLSKKKFPAYATHLLAWQIYALNDDSKYQKSLSSIVVQLADDENYLVRLLLDLPVSEEIVENVKPKTDFQWQRNKIEKARFCRELTPEEAEFNTIDVDVLKLIFSESCFR